MAITPVTKENLEKTKAARDGLMEGPCWDDTVEGHSFWSDVHARLGRIVDNMEIVLNPKKTPKKL